MPYYAAGQSRLYYEEAGEGGLAVVLAHGVGGNHASWFNQVPTLSGKFRTIAFDHRGFGNSDDVEGIGASAYVDDLERLFDELWSNDDDAQYRTAQQILQNRYAFFEHDVIDPAGDGPMLGAPWAERRSPDASVR